MSKLSTKEFEYKCMSVIEQIVSIDIKQNRQGAIKVAERMLEKAKTTNNKQVIDIYARVLKEFEIATDEEYTILREQIFSDDDSDIDYDDQDDSENEDGKNE